MKSFRKEFKINEYFALNNNRWRKGNENQFFRKGETEEQNLSRKGGVVRESGKVVASDFCFPILI